MLYQLLTHSFGWLADQASREDNKSQGPNEVQERVFPHLDRYEEEQPKNDYSNNSHPLVMVEPFIIVLR